MLTYAPDVDPTTPEILTDVVNVIPTMKGYAGCNSGVATSYPALASECRNMVTARKLDNTRRFFVTTQTSINEGIGGSWTSVAAGTPDIGAENRWSITQFGDVTLATAKSVTLQASTTGNFATVSGAPKATCMATGQGFVMLADYDDGTNTTDGWFCSGIFDYTTWTPSITTQCTKGRLVDTPGRITGLVGYGTTFVSFKQDSMYLANYVGSPSVFQWQLIPGVVGCRSKEAICQAANNIYFVGPDNFYVFDGSRPIPIGNPLREWFFKTEVNKAYIYKISATYDPANQFIWFFYPSSTSTVLDKALVYHIPTSRWGKVAISIEAANISLGDPITIDGLSAFAATIDALPAVTFDSDFWNQANQIMAYIDTSHQVNTLSGASVSSSITTGNYGSTDEFSMLRKIKPRFAVAPYSAWLTHQYDNDYGDDWQTGQVSYLMNGRFDVLWSARWHRGAVQFDGPWELLSFSADFVPSGIE